MVTHKRHDTPNRDALGVLLELDSSHATTEYTRQGNVLRQAQPAEMQIFPRLGAKRN